MKSGFVCASMIAVAFGLALFGVDCANAQGQRVEDKADVSSQGIVGDSKQRSSSGDEKSSASPEDRRDDTVSRGGVDGPAESSGAPDVQTPLSGQNENRSGVESIPVRQSESDTATSPGIETVVVTARRSAEDIQKVPIAVTAFSSKDLERQQINSAQDLNGLVPSVAVSSASLLRNSETVNIRGQGANINASPGVIMYYAEVPLAADTFFSTQGGPGKFFDLSSLQVLKGSQGTLFGRNTTGGALLLDPHKPEPGFQASMTSEVSNFQGKGLEGILNVPVVQDELLLRLGAKFYDRKGFTENIVDGQNVDGKGFRTERLGLMWKPRSDVRNYLMGMYTHSADNGNSEVLENINRTVMIGPINVGCAAVAIAAAKAGLGNTDCGRTIIAAQQARGVRSVALSDTPNDILDTGGVIDHFDYDINDRLTFRNIASYQMLKHHYRWDQDGSVLPISEFDAPDTMNVSHFDQYTEELQLQGHAFGNDLKYVAGLYYQYSHPDGLSQNSASIFGLANILAVSQISSRSYGPYAQTTFDFGRVVNSLDGLKVTVGARYTSDHSSGMIQTGAYGPGGSLLFGGNAAETNVENSSPTWTVGLDYKVPTTLLYGKVSHGYKSGGISPQAVTPSRYTFQPEYVLNYELGAKSDFVIGAIPFRVDSALFYTDYTDMQKVVTDSNGAELGAATINVAKAAIEGFETEITAQPMEGLTLAATYAYTYGKYLDFSQTLNAITPQVDCTGRAIPNGGVSELKCSPFTYIPRHQGSFTARYQVPIPESVGRVDGNLTYTYVDRAYTSPDTVPAAEPGAWIGGYGLLNASIGWTSMYGSAFDLRLFGANLADRTYRVANSNVWNFLYFQSSLYGEPRTFGLQLSYRWME